MIRFRKLAALAFMALALASLAAVPPVQAALSTQIFAKIRAVLSGSGDLGNPSVEINTSTDALFKTFSSGTGNNQANLMWSDTRTLAASANESLDLAGVLTDAFGVTITFAKIKVIMVSANAANTNDVIVGAAASNAFVGPLGGTSPTYAVRPGGVALFVAPLTGWTVTPGTGDLLKIANGGAGTGVDYTIVLVGTDS